MKTSAGDIGAEENCESERDVVTVRIDLRRLLFLCLSVSPAEESNLLSHDLGDVPITDGARDDVNGDLYAASDFGVFRLAAGTTSWTAGAPGLPNVEVTSLTIIPAARKMYVATHGQGAWLLNLP